MEWLEMSDLDLSFATFKGPKGEACPIPQAFVGRVCVQSLELCADLESKLVCDSQQLTILDRCIQQYHASWAFRLVLNNAFYLQVVVERYRKEKSLPDLYRTKFLVSPDLTLSQFMFTLR